MRSPYWSVSLLLPLLLLSWLVYAPWGTSIGLPGSTPRFVPLLLQLRLQLSSELSLMTMLLLLLLGFNLRLLQLHTHLLFCLSSF